MITLKTIVSFLIFAWCFWMAAPVHAQTFVMYEGKKINEWKKNAKVGVWHLQHVKEPIKVVGTMVDGQHMKDITYTEKGKVIARQKDENEIELFINGKFEAFIIKRVPIEHGSEPVQLKSFNMQNEPIKLPYSLNLVPATGGTIDANVLEEWLNKLIIPPFDYDYRTKYKANLKFPEHYKGGSYKFKLYIDEHGKIVKTERVEGPNDQIATQFQQYFKNLPRFQPQFVLGKFETSEMLIVMSIRN